MKHALAIFASLICAPTLYEMRGAGLTRLQVLFSINAIWKLLASSFDTLNHEKKH